MLVACQPRGFLVRFYAANGQYMQDGAGVRPHPRDESSHLIANLETRMGCIVKQVNG